MKAEETRHLPNYTAPVEREEEVVEEKEEPRVRARTVKDDGWE